MPKINRDRTRLKDILSAIDEISIYEKEGRGIKEERAIAYMIAIIGEAVNHLSKDLKEDNNDVPWKYINGMRNRLIHEYANINVRLLWNVVDNELPKLKKQVEEILKKI